MYRFFAYANLAQPGLHVWREGTPLKLFLHPVSSSAGAGWIEFQCDLDPATSQQVRFMLFSFQPNGSPGDFESDAFQRVLPRLASGEFPQSVWFVQGASRVVLTDPRLTTQAAVRIHLISQTRYRPGEMYVWDPVTGVDRRISQTDQDSLGPVFDVNLAPHERSFVNFKFVARLDGQFKVFEPDTANRWWVADDGTEIWTHSGTAEIAHTVPEKRTLTLHYRQTFDSPALLHLWAENGDFATDVVGVPGAEGWTTYKTAIYTQLPYGCRFYNPGLSDAWEHEEAKRTRLVLTDHTEWWTLEGDQAICSSPPSPNVQLDLAIANSAVSRLQGPLFAHVWVNRARGPIASNVPVDSNGRVSLRIYPDVTTSIKFHDTSGNWEPYRHAIQVRAEETPLQRFVVLNRPPLLAKKPPADLVSDPPFSIRRPGVCEEAGELRFVVHTPHAADVSVIGEWTDWTTRPLQMRLTRDGTYWWGSVQGDCATLGNLAYSGNHALRRRASMLGCASARGCREVCHGWQGIGVDRRSFRGIVGSSSSRGDVPLD